MIGSFALSLWLASVPTSVPPSGAKAPRVTVPARAEEAPLLSTGVPVERALDAGRSHTYRVTLETGQFLSVTIRQQGTDVVAGLLRPDGTEVVSVNAFSDDPRVEVLTAIADTAGTHTVRISAAPGSQPRGRYTILLEELRPSGPSDEKRVAAERSFAQGVKARNPREAAGWPVSLATLGEALVRFREMSDRRGEMKTLLELATTQYFLSQPEALATARDGERIAREIGDRAATARVLKSIGNILVFTGDVGGAVPALEESAKISHEIGNRVGEERALNDAAIAYRRLGDVQRAILLYERALPIAHAVKDGPSESRILNNLGVAYKAAGELDKAIHVYERAVARSRASKDLKGEINALHNLGNVQREGGHPRKALALHQAALQIARKIGDKTLVSFPLNSTSTDYYDLKQYTKALEASREALEIRRETGDVSGVASSTWSNGRALHRLGRTGEALASMQEALGIYRSIHEQLSVGEALYELAEMQRDGGDLAAALESIRDSVHLDESLREQMTSPDLRASFVASEQNRYDLFIDVLQRMHRVDPSAGHDAEALQVSERARARGLLDSILDARVDLRQGADPALLDKERSLQKQIGDASAQLSKSLTSADAASDGAARAEALDRLTGDYSQLQAEIRRQSPRYAAVTQPQPMSSSEIQQTVLDGDTVILEFELGKERSWLWAVTPQSIKSVALPPRPKIEAAARSLYALFTARQSREHENDADHRSRVAQADAALAKQAALVSRLLLGAIGRELSGPWKGRRLAIVAAGALEYLPFAALPEPSAPGSTPGPRPPLVSRHEIVMIPSASVVGVIRRETAGRAPAPRALAILADPVFETSDPRLLANGGRSRPAVASAHPAPPRELASRGGGWARLPFSRAEASAITSLLGPDEVFKATDFAANRGIVTSGALSGYRIVHFATHGVLDSGHPALSGLVLSLIDERGAPQDGILRLHDIYGLRLDADLVVLSACQTALGKEIKGEGLVGLARAFMYAGSPRVVASLWQVSDVATAELMEKFYRGVLQQGLPPAAALRAAQLEMSKDSRWTHPYFWAGFVIQGDWK